jgi:opacity protein-like surface antigen
MKVIPVLLTGKLVLPAKPFEPYLMLGVGLYFVDIKGSAFGFTVSDDDTTFGFHIGLGATFDITPNAFLGVEGKYIVAKPTLFDEDVNIDGFTVTGNLGFRF